MTRRFDIYFTGTFDDGVDAASAAATYAEAAGISLAQSQALFHNAPGKARSECSAEQADLFQALLRQLGIRSVRRPAGIPLLEAAAEPGTAATWPPGSGAYTLDPMDRRPLAFRFTGQGFEYFRIWIVNLLLTLATLGLYGPWAKVRNRQYFYGNTQLDDATFEYTADPLRMLLGRIIAMGLLGAYYAAGLISPQASALAGLLLLVALPWVTNLSLAFHARNTVYRNLRFRFQGNYADAFVVLLLWPLAGVLSLGLLVPVAVQRWQRYYITRHRYGDKSFQFSAGSGSFYRLCLWAFGIGLLGFLAGALLSMLVPRLGILGLLAGYALAMVYFTTALKNLVYNHTTLASHCLSADFELRGFGWIMLSNFALVLLTLGLYLPWAKVRVAHYAAEHIVFHAAGDLDRFAAISQPDTSAFGEEFSDVFALDLGV
jgi:uncharacterized membrane protein YjgN (DUF898 family)